MWIPLSLKNPTKNVGDVLSNPRQEYDFNLTFSSVFAGAGAGSSSSVLTSPRWLKGCTGPKKGESLEEKEIPALETNHPFFWGGFMLVFRGRKNNKINQQKPILLEQKKGDLKRRFKFPKTTPPLPSKNTINQ